MNGKTLVRAARETDHGQRGPHTDLCIECIDAKAFTSRALAGKMPFLAAALEDEQKTPGTIKIAERFGAVDDLLNWLGMIEVAQTRRSWLQTIGIARVIDLGRLAVHRGETILALECARAIQLPLFATYDCVESACAFVSTTRFSVSGLALKWLDLDPDPYRLPVMPEVFWRACLKTDGACARRRFLLMAISLHEGLMPDMALVMSVVDDIRSAGAPGIAPGSVAGGESKASAYWTLLLKHSAMQLECEKHWFKLITRELILHAGWGVAPARVPCKHIATASCGWRTDPTRTDRGRAPQPWDLDRSPSSIPQLETDPEPPRICRPIGEQAAPGLSSPPSSAPMGAPDAPSERPAKRQKSGAPSGGPCAAPLAPQVLAEKGASTLWPAHPL